MTLHPECEETQMPQDQTNETVNIFEGLSQSDIDRLQAATQVFLIHSDFDVTIERRGQDVWAVHVGGSVVDRDLKRRYQPLPSAQYAVFLEETRFPLPEALRIAEKWVTAKLATQSAELQA